MWHDSSICVTWLFHKRESTHTRYLLSYVWHDSFICVTWLIHICDMTHSYMWHDSSICVTWLLHDRDSTPMFTLTRGRAVTTNLKSPHFVEYTSLLQKSPAKETIFSKSLTRGRAVTTHLKSQLDSHFVQYTYEVATISRPFKITSLLQKSPAKETIFSKSIPTVTLYSRPMGWLRLVGSNHRSLLQNIVSFIWLFCKRIL